MRALVQRVTQAWVNIDGEETGRIGQGLLVLLAIMQDDTQEQLRRMVNKVADLRIFPDADGKMNRSVQETGKAVLVVPQFTLAAQLHKGNRPSFFAAAAPSIAEASVNAFCEGLRQKNLTVAEGRFGADMQVHLVNDGPVTLWLDL
ncbi:MAG: D-tyrosyl-tRNA(Tyr) deacylase [Magnetococcales bacterium]|nr:D-tyrosyl-tRNA(Tyr) deacylase [Magnetococcales bacterium]